MYLSFPCLQQALTLQVSKEEVININQERKFMPENVMTVEVTHKTEIASTE